MKKLFTFATLVAAFIASIACSQDAVSEVGHSLDQTVIKIDIPDSRTSLGEKVDDEYPVYWSEGDIIVANGAPSSSIVISESGKSAAFSFLGNTLSTPYHITYPYMEGSSCAADRATVVFSAEQQFVEGTFGINYAPMCGYSEDGVSAVMKHLAGVLRFAVKGEDTLAKVEIIAEEGVALSGEFDVDCETGSITAIEDKTSNKITYTVNQTLSSEATILYIAVPSGDFGTCKILFTDSKGLCMNAQWCATNVRAGIVREFKEFTYKGGALLTLDSMNSESDEVEMMDVPSNEIWYTSTDDEIVTPYATDVFGAKIVSNTYTGGAAVSKLSENASNAKILSNTYENGKGVIKFDGDITKIGANAFYECSRLKSITIPYSVAEIGKWAFWYCNNLLSVYCKPTTPPILSSDGIFDNDSVCKIYVPTASIEAYKAAEYWSEYADYIQEEGGSQSANNKIYYTSSDGAVVTPYKTDVFGANIVSNTYTDGQGVITFDGDVTHIGDRAFYKCTTLTSVTIGNSVTSIRGYAFYNCSSLTSVYITDLSAWCKIAFSGGASNPCYNGAKLYLNGSELTEVTIPSDITEIKRAAFSGCTSITSVNIHNRVTSIGNVAFSRCSNLTSITVGKNMTSMGVNAFYLCENLTRVNISDLSAWCKITFELSDGKYYGGTNPLQYARRLYLNGSELTELTIPSDITEIKNFAFAWCDSLTSVTIPDSVTSIGSYAFYGCPSLTRVDIADLSAWCKIDFGASSANPLYNNRGNLYIDGVKATNITIPSDVTDIKQYAFYGCNSLTITIPDSVTSIGRAAFFNCNCLTSIKIPDSVVEIGAHAFASCRKLEYFYGKFVSNDNRCLIVDNILNSYAGGAKVTSYEIPSNITAIDAHAFQDNDYLKSVTIHDGVTSIGIKAFFHCSALKSVYCKHSTPPTGGNNMFSYTKNDIDYPLGCTIYVPAASVETYKTAQYWSDYSSYIVGYDF